MESGKEGRHFKRKDFVVLEKIRKDKFKVVAIKCRGNSKNNLRKYC